MDVVAVATVTMYLMAPLVALIGLAVLYLYRHRKLLKEEYSYVYYGLMGLITGVVPVFLVTPVTVSLYRYWRVLWALLIVLVGLAVLCLSRYRAPIKKEYPYVYDGLLGLITGVIILVVMTPVVFTLFTISPPGPGGGDFPSAELNITDDTGVVQIEIVDTGDYDSIGLVDPDGMRSTMGNFEPGTTITLRSNDEVINYLNSPENNITVLTMSGTKTVGSVSELPSEYQKAPDGLINPETDIGNYSNASVATVACLYDSADTSEFGKKRVPANVSVPCNTPVLAQNDSVTPGGSVEPIRPSVVDTLTSPITYRQDDYSVIGTVDSSENVIQSFEITDEVLREQDEGNETN